MISFICALFKLYFVEPICSFFGVWPRVTYDVVVNKAQYKDHPAGPGRVLIKTAKKMTMSKITYVAASFDDVFIDITKVFKDYLGPNLDFFGQSFPICYLEQLCKMPPNSFVSLHVGVKGEIEPRIFYPGHIFVGHNDFLDL